MERHSAKIIADPDDLEKVQAGVVEVAWSYRNTHWYSDGIAHSMCTVMGGQMDIDIIPTVPLDRYPIDKSKADLQGLWTYRI